MENKKGNEVFTYTYSAVEQAELKRIRKKYMPPEEDKMAKLRRLDASVNQKGLVVSLMDGILGALIMGIGMCCVMVRKGSLFIPGIIIGIIGMALMGVGYPVYGYVIKRERAKIAPEVLKLADELIM